MPNQNGLIYILMSKNQALQVLYCDYATCTVNTNFILMGIVTVIFHGATVMRAEKNKNKLNPTITHYMVIK